MAIYFPPPPPFVGGSQPYAPLVGVRSEAGIPINNPPFQHPERNPAQAAAIIAISQPDPFNYARWTYDYIGNWQPYGPPQLDPSITAVEVDNPPFQHPERTRLHQAIVAIWQPDPYAYVPWTHDFFGGRQAYEPAKLSPGTPGQSIDRPYAIHPERTPAIAAIKAIWAADPYNYQPWTYDYVGARQPYEPAHLAPSITAVAVNNPPFSQRDPMTAVLAAWNAPSQPYPMTITHTITMRLRVNRGYLIL